MKTSKREETVSESVSPTAEQICEAGALRISEVTRQFGLGRTTVFALLKSGALPKARVGNITVIPRAALVKLLVNNLVTAG